LKLNNNHAVLNSIKKRKEIEEESFNGVLLLNFLVKKTDKESLARGIFLFFQL